MVSLSLPGVRDVLFGSKPKASVSTLPTMTPAQQKALDTLLEQLSNDSQLTAAYTGALPGTRTGPMQSTSLNALEQMAMNAVGPTGTDATSTQALTDIINAKPQDLTEYFQSTITAPAMQAYTQQVLPELTRRFSGLSGFGSDRMVQEGIATGNTMTGIAEAMGKASASALANQQQNKLTAATQLPGVSGQQISNLLGAESGYADIAGRSDVAQYTEFQRQQDARQQRIQSILSALGIKPVENIGMVTPGSAGLFQSFAGGVGTGAGIGVGTKLASDIRVKTNIIRIATHIRGFGIYLFQYIWSPKVHIGVMAQEVQPILPNAVTQCPNGLLMVDYAQLN